MKYADYHNANADITAQLYYAKSYDELTPFMQAMIDDQIAEDWFTLQDKLMPAFLRK